MICPFKALGWKFSTSWNAIRQFFVMNSSFLINLTTGIYITPVHSELSDTSVDNQLDYEKFHFWLILHFFPVCRVHYDSPITVSPLPHALVCAIWHTRTQSNSGVLNLKSNICWVWTCFQIPQWQTLIVRFTEVAWPFDCVPEWETEVADHRQKSSVV